MQFFPSDGLPASIRTHQMARTWYSHACPFIDMKWANASPSHRRGLAEALVWVTTAMVTSARDTPDKDALRKALFHWSFNVTARGKHPVEEADVPSEFAQEAAWIARRSIPLRSFASPAIVRRAMDAITVKLDGTQAAAPTVARRRAALFSALQYAVELELLPNNPLKQLKLRRPIVAEAVDRRVVVNHAQARSLLYAVRVAYPSLEAYFACLYYAALRPAEARHLRVNDCVLPETGWGELVLLGSTPDSNGVWTDSGEANEDRQLKHRGVSVTRPVPASPELVEILRHHIATFPTSPDGRLFVTRIGRAGVPLPLPFTRPLRMGTAYRVWDIVRAAAFTEAEYASPMAKRPYDLRHAAVSTMAQCRRPADPGRRVGRAQRHGPAQGLRKVHLWTGRAGQGSHRVRSGPADYRSPGCGPNFLPYSSQTAVDGRFWPITAGNHERAPNRRFRRSGALCARGGR